MAYVYQVGFDIERRQMDELEIGSSLERVLGYLRTLLPNEPGYVTARAIYSLDGPGKTHLLVESTWEDWEELQEHRRSSLAENKVLTEFAPQVEMSELEVHVYREVP